MKIKCNETVSIARTDDRSKPNVQLYKDKVMNVIDEIASTAIRLGFASKCDEPKTNAIEDVIEEVLEEKMIDKNHKNKMFSDTHKNKNNDRKKGKKGL